MKKKRVCNIFLLLCICGIVCSGCAGEELLNRVPKTTALNAKEEEKTPEPAVTLEPAVSYINENASRFTYNRLSEAEKLWYRDMEKLLGSLSEKGMLSEEGIRQGLDETDIDKVFQCLLNDHPELFYVDGYTYTKYMLGEEILSIEFAGNYNLEPDTVKLRKQEIEEAADKILSGISMEESDYAKIKYVYETLILNTDYDLTAPDNQNIYSVFVHHKSVCQGYAKATQYLLNRLGVECTLVQGVVDTGEGHAWNLVMSDSGFYYLDTTWGDVHYQTGEEQIPAEGYPEINYDYLCITTKELLRTHTLTPLVPMPECVDTKDNFYVREGTYFTEYDREQLEKVFTQTDGLQKQVVNIRCKTQECFLEIKNALIDEYEIFEYMDAGEGQISYSHNEKGLSMSFWVTNE